MGFKCFVPNCKSGYKTCTDKVSLFRPPSAEEELQKWRKAIPRSDRLMTVKNRVCEKHFPEDLIIRDWFSAHDGRVLLDEKRGWAKLVDGAVPSIFPGCPKYLSKPVKPPRKRPAERKFVENSQPKRRKNNPAETELPMSADNSDNDMKDPTSSFQFLWEHSNEVKFPGEHWGIHKIDVNCCRSIIFTEVICNDKRPITRKQLCIYDDSEVRTFVFNRDVNAFKERQDINAGIVLKTEESLILFDKEKVCRGGPSIKQYADVQPECAFPDEVGVWRHKDCNFLTGVTGIRDPCSKLETTLRVHQSRRKSAKLLSRIRLNMSPKKREKITLLRKARVAQRRARIHLQKRVTLTEVKIKNLQNKIVALTQETFEEKMEELNLPDAQKMVITECISAGKCSAKRGRRYTSEWLLMCMLMHIRSPTAYKFIRENEILPLPCTKTIRNYLSMMNIKCGFDEDFFRAMKLKLQSKTTLQKHGLLIFDEIQVRKSMAVNSKTLTYSGLVDMGDYQEEKKKNLLADHGLVFMFHAIADSYSQPIAVFASKDSTKGTVLAQLVVKAILLLEEAGAIVDGMICDGASTNRNMWKHLGISGKLGTTTNSFINPADDDRKVYVFSDAPHLMKCIRNRLFNMKTLEVSISIFKELF